MSKSSLVEYYVGMHGNSPLVFCNYEGRLVEIDDGGLSLWELVEKILEFTEYHSSFNRAAEKLETGPGRFRSSLDIWRHVLAFRPQTTLEDVMNVLFEHRSELVGQFCCVIMRRVFRLKSLHDDMEFYNYRDTDEYGLEFSDWAFTN